MLLLRDAVDVMQAAAPERRVSGQKGLRVVYAYG